MLSRLPVPRRFLAIAVAACALLAVPLTAQARVFFGVGFGFPLFAPVYPFYAPPPVVFAPPPIVYAPPPVVFSPPAAYAAGPGGRCFAGAYVCPLDRPVPVGAPCSCPTNFGRAGGRSG